MMSEVTNSLMSMQELFNLAFARLDRAAERRREFSQTWGQYIDTHPWDVDLRAVEPTTFEILAVMREPAPLDLSMIFSEWLAALRAALDNGFYAWVAAATGQNPPPSAARLQFPICSTPTEYRRHTKRLVGIPPRSWTRSKALSPTNHLPDLRATSSTGFTNSRAPTGTALLMSVLGESRSTGCVSGFPKE